MSTPPFTVYPLRWSADPAAMIRFLVTLGMARAVTGPGDGFGELVAGGGGRVMVHRVHAPSGSDAPAEDGPSADRAAPGATDLCLSVPDTVLAAQHLRDHGLEVAVWDETYGKQGVVRGPVGEEISLNEQQRDLYGYEGHDASGADPRLSVVAVRPCEDMLRDAAFFAQLGFTPVGEASAWWQELHGAPGAGIIGLHPPGPGLPLPAEDPRASGADRVLGPPAVIRLGFATTEPLDALAARLQAAGYDARVREQAGVSSVRVTDPDGCLLEIHPLAR